MAESKQWKDRGPVSVSPRLARPCKCEWWLCPECLHVWDGDAVPWSPHYNPDESVVPGCYGQPVRVARKTLHLPVTSGWPTRVYHHPPKSTDEEDVMEPGVRTRLRRLRLAWRTLARRR